MPSERDDAFPPLERTTSAQIRRKPVSSAIHDVFPPEYDYALATERWRPDDSQMFTARPTVSKLLDSGYSSLEGLRTDPEIVRYDTRGPELVGHQTIGPVPLDHQPTGPLPVDHHITPIPPGTKPSLEPRSRPSRLWNFKRWLKPKKNLDS